MHIWNISCRHPIDNKLRLPKYSFIGPHFADAQHLYNFSHETTGKQLSVTFLSFRICEYYGDKCSRTEYCACCCFGIYLNISSDLTGNCWVNLCSCLRRSFYRNTSSDMLRNFQTGRKDWTIRIYSVIPQINLVRNIYTRDHKMQQ